MWRDFFIPDGWISDATIQSALLDSIEFAERVIVNEMVKCARHRVVVYLDVKVSRDGEAARAAMRRSLAARLPWADVQLNALGIAAEVAAFIQAHGNDGVAQHMPDDWLDAFSASGTPDQVIDTIQRLTTAGADSIVLQPLNGDPDCLDEYIRDLMPRLKS